MVDFPQPIVNANHDFYMYFDFLLFNILYHYPEERTWLLGNIRFLFFLTYFLGSWNIASWMCFINKILLLAEICDKRKEKRKIYQPILHFSPYKISDWFFSYFFYLKLRCSKTNFGHCLMDDLIHPISINTSYFHQNITSILLTKFGRYAEQPVSLNQQLFDSNITSLPDELCYLLITLDFLNWQIIKNKQKFTENPFFQMQKIKINWLFRKFLNILTAFCPQVRTYAESLIFVIHA